MNEDYQERTQKGFEQFVLYVLSGEVWTRPGLDLKSRSCVTIAALTSLGRPRGLALNIEMGLENELTRQEIQEALVHLAFYAGLLAAGGALQTAGEVFTRLDG